MTVIAEPATALLPGGGVVTYEEQGDPNGVPTLFLHGTPGSRHTAGWVLAPDDPVRRAARLISVDRPGTGGTTAGGKGFDPGVAAVMAVADALQLKRFHVIAVSGGAPFALLMAARHPERVERLLVLCGAIPLARTDRALLTRGARVAQDLCRWTPALARTLMARNRRRTPGPEPVDVPAADRLAQSQLLADPARVAAREADLQAVLAQRAAGAVTEMAAYTRPWSLRPDQVSVPVVGWHGAADDAAPLGPTQAFLTATRSGVVHVVEGGHLAPLLHTAEVAAALASSA